MASIPILDKKVINTEKSLFCKCEKATKTLLRLKSLFVLTPAAGRLKGRNRALEAVINHLILFDILIYVFI